MHSRKSRLVAAALAAGSSLIALPALAGSSSGGASGPQLQYVYGGSAGTVVFIHGKADCGTSMTSCSSNDSATGPAGYFTNDSNSADMQNEATTTINSNGTVSYYEAFSIGFDLESQGYWYSADDVGYCLQDLYSGTNNSGCNPSKYQRSNFRIVTHSAGATVIDRLVSTGWYGINSHIVGDIVSLAPALTGSRASSALYGVDGYSGWCSTLVGWLAGFALKNNGAQSLTRGTVTGQANEGYAGRSPIWILKVMSTGGSWSANNDGCGTLTGGTTVREDDNDCEMGLLAGCLGYSNADDMDGLVYWSDTDPTNNTSSNGCNTYDTYDGNGVSSCHYYSQYSGAYWHWFTSWANHSHSRDDAYTTLGDWQTASGCYERSPGTCVGQYGL
ncbi:MAG: hypothetical protein ACLQVI_00835 [Polyangiaceae bacterium]